MHLNFSKEAEAIRITLQQWRRQLHQIPEVGLFLPETRRFVTDRLDEMGISYQTFEDHSGVIALLGNKEGRTIAVRADMDALLIQEENEVPYASRHSGCMHACGHDAHTAMLLGTAYILKKYEEKIPGCVKLIFQPAEEMPPGGAVVMIEEGVLNNPKTDAILGIHMDRMVKGASNGNFVIKTGSVMGADDVIRLTIKGKGGHASEPDTCVDTILTACSCVTALQQVVSRNTDPNQAAVITITDFHAGTGTDNVIPGEAYLIGTIRSSDEETRRKIRRRVREVIEGVTKAAGADYELELIPDYPVLTNDRYVTDLVKQSVAELYGADEIIRKKTCSMGGDDFAFFSREIPGCYFTLVADKAASDGQVYPAHHPRFDIDDSLLDRGAAVLLQTIFKYLEDADK